MQLSGKLYLGTLYRLKMGGGRVRSVELARELGYTKPSVSRAIGNFEKEGFLTVQGGGELALTEKGLKEAKELVKRQEIIAEFLEMTCGATSQEALYDAIRMEPGVSRKMLQGMKRFIKEVRALEAGEEA